MDLANKQNMIILLYKKYDHLKIERFLIMFKFSNTM